MKRVTFSGFVENGKLSLRNPQIFKVELQDLHGDVSVEIVEGRGKRSQQQNKYYHGVVCRLISDHTGYLPEEVHEFLKEKFLTEKKHVIIGTDERDIETASTTRLTTKEFEEFTENVRRWAAVELQINIPEPNQEDFV